MSLNETFSNIFEAVADKIPYFSEAKETFLDSGFATHVLAFLIFFSFLIVARIFILVYEKYLLKFAKSSKIPVDEKVIQGMRKPVFYGLLFLGFFFGIKIIDFPGSVEIYVTKIVLSLMTIFFSYFGIKIVDFVVRQWITSFISKTKTKADDIFLPLLHKTVTLLFIILATLFILNLWGVKIAPFLASLGIAGLAIGFALKDSLANVFGGISLIVDRTFKVGDFIELDPQTRGSIVDIGLRSTKIRTFDNHIILVPNGDLSNKLVTNFAKPGPQTRISLNVNVAYGTDVEKVKKVLMKCVSVVDKEILDSDKEAKVYFTNMGDFSLEFRLIIPIKDYKKRFINEERLRTEVYDKLRKNKITIPFPTYTIKRK